MTTPTIRERAREILSTALLDGQNQIHDLKSGKATPQEIEERMFKSLDHHSEKMEVLITLTAEETRKKCLEALPKETIYPGTECSTDAHNNVVRQARKALTELTLDV